MTLFMLLLTKNFKLIYNIIEFSYIYILKTTYKYHVGFYSQ